MQRREFLAGAATVATSQLFFSHASFGQRISLKLPNIIDAHCHLFNARDLPMVGFVEKCIIPNNPKFREAAKEYNEVIDFFLKYLAGKLNDAAVSASDEIKEIDKIEANPASKRGSATIRSQDLKLLTTMIEDIKQQRTLGPKLKGHEYFLQNIVIGLMHREAFPVKYFVKGFALGDILNNDDQAYNHENWQESDYLARHLYDFSGGHFGYYLRWGCLLTRYRYELAEELQKIHRGRAVLLTPALVDYTKWLDVDEPTSMRDQVDVLSRISIRKPDAASPKIHGFVAFDPLREAIHNKLNLPPAQSPLAIVQYAVEKKGFVGIKLYPPMGFSPANNEATGAEFPCWVRYGPGSPGDSATCIDPTNKPGALGNMPGKLIDDALNKLYEWSSKAAVPIMSHSNDSYGVNPGYGKRANPKLWAAVLSKYPDLRLNLAHFGGFEEAFDENEVFHEAKLTETWEWEIGRLWQKFPSAQVYADISYFNELLGADACRSNSNCEREIIKKAMIKFCGTFPAAKTKLIYGSDWIMTGLERKFPAVTEKQLYPEIVAAFLTEIDLSDQDIMFRNSVNFLGLNGSNLNRIRLAKFYSDARADSSWLSVFD